jgi:hypothetical protein
MRHVGVSKSLTTSAEDPRIKQVEQPVVVRVFCPLSSFAYYLRTGAASFITDVRSLLIPHWDDQRVALLQALDDALALDEPVLAYGVLANVIESHPELYFDQEPRDALELIAQASGNQPIMPERAKTALDHFEWLKGQLETHRPFPELDEFQIRFETPLTLDTERPIEGAYNGVQQSAPQPADVCDVSCRLLVAVAELRLLAESKQRALKSALTAEHKARMFIRSLWSLLEDAQRATLRDLFESATGSNLERTCAIQ